MPEPLFRGALCALVTPFRGGALDEAAIVSLAQRQIFHGADGLVAASVTGESATLSPKEHRRVLELTVQAADGQVPVIAGVGSNSTAEALELVAYAKSIGAQGVLAATPYYNRPSQEGLARHFAALGEAADLPILIHNAPARSGVDISNETVAGLAGLPRIAGLVDATGDLGRVSLMRGLVPQGFVLLSGDDATALGYMAQGGHGCLSLTCNVAPRSFSAFARACLDQEWAKALAAQDRMIRLHQALAADEPAAAKFGLSRMGGLCAAETRLPIAPCPEHSWAAVMEAMGEAADAMNKIKWAPAQADKKAG